MENDELILNKLELLNQEVSFIKEHIIDITLTQEDVCSLNEAEEDLKKGRTRKL